MNFGFRPFGALPFGGLPSQAVPPTPPTVYEGIDTRRIREEEEVISILAAVLPIITRH